jgi:hypothetical protein
MDYQFSSHEVFSRAFKRAFNMLPNEYRKRKLNQPCLNRMSLDFLNCIHKEILSIPQFCRFSSTYINGKECTFSEIKNIMPSDNTILVIHDLTGQANFYLGEKTESITPDFLKSYRLIPEFEAISFKIKVYPEHLVYVLQYVNQIFLLNYISINSEPYLILNEVVYDCETSCLTAELYIKTKTI